ncbi:MAG: hypothetical protein A2075_01375 [Geobacteraceae bacterium GWC2_58_44]|nr:MAG: hypothetical protein A2075_01375 [Geobacteraceae bacterium GWC2_58_44]
MLPLFAAACALVSVLLLLSSGFGTRLNLWQFRTGFSILKVAAYSGLGCALLALVSGVLAVRKRHLAAVILSLVALLLAIFAFGVPYSWKQKAQSHPRIHDISTDLDNPPNFVDIAPLRQGRVEHGGAMIAALQLKAYPDIKTLVLPVSKDQAFASALATAREMGWEIVAAVPAEGRIEATDTTFWFGFKDDIVIRIFPAGERSLLDIRSVSRVGISDVGTNAERIRTFLAKISHQAK